MSEKLLKPVPRETGQQASPGGRGLESLQARLEEVQGLEEEGGAGAADGAAQESLDHRVQLQGKGTVSAALPSRPLLGKGPAETRLGEPCLILMLWRREKRSQV